MRKRPVLLATLAVVVLGVAGATAVFIVGSKQRRDDRAAYLRYERSAVAAVREIRRVGEEMRSQLAGMRGGRQASVAAPDELDAWRLVIATARSAVAALEPPGFMRDLEKRWLSAIDAYARVPNLLARAALLEAQGTLDEAGHRVDDAARVMQFHRRRLGLAPTPELPDPAAP